MKLFNSKLILSACAMTLLVSCADNEMINFSATQPDSIANLTYLNNYDALKTYVDRTENPNFKLGSGVTVSDFNTKGLVYCLTCANFDEMTAGNAMKYSSCVANDGTMDFSTVKSFISNAEEAGLSIFGHTLAWHSQQNNTYLKGIITDPNAANYVVHISTTSAKTDVYGWQLFAHTKTALTVGKNYTLSMRVKTSENYTITCWPSIDGGSCQYYPTPSVPSTTEWTTISSTFEAKYAIDQLGFQFGTLAGDIYMDDVSLTEEGSTENLLNNGDFSENDLTYWTFPSWLSGETVAIEKDESAEASTFTEETVKDTLTYAMTNWISGMMDACGGYVKSWDVVNEALSGVDLDGDGYYDLQSATRGTVSATDAASNFYWQDYLGDIDYVRTAVKLARQYFAESGGEPSELKLFINDYNLESDWDDNKKLKSLINWISKWEADGTTKIDGIGTQMHVSCYANQTTLESKKEHIVNMLKLMAATGKLVKISELDMGYIDAEGNSVATNDMTESQIKEQANLYQFIIQAYFENVPAAQRYGITQWCCTDSPASSSWRAGMPIGLWTESYDRKETYAGFANGLAGKVLFTNEY